MSQKSMSEWTFCIMWDVLVHNTILLTSKPNKEALEIHRNRVLRSKMTNLLSMFQTDNSNIIEEIEPVDDYMKKLRENRHKK